LFLYYAPYAPHEPYDKNLPARDDCPALGPYGPESWGEADVSDKPPYVQDAPWTDRERHMPTWIRAGQCNLIHGVDRSVGRIVDALADTGRLSNTMLVFMSDNGYMWGEHREYFKAKPYEEAIRVPMVVRYDPITSGRSESRIALNLDVAPTFADLANVGAPGVQGRSLLPVIADAKVPWRTDFLLEHSYGTEKPPYRAPDYCGIRTTGWKYVLYMWGAEELYDLTSDPEELNNLADVPSAQARRKLLRAETLERCRPLPPRFPR
jgi:arylsulfatase A-like enzyme